MLQTPASMSGSALFQLCDHELVNPSLWAYHPHLCNAGGDVPASWGKIKDADLFIHQPCVRPYFRGQRHIRKQDINFLLP